MNIGSKLIQLQDTSYVILSPNQDSLTYREKFVLMKVDKKGIPIWRQQFTAASGIRGIALQETSDNGFLIIGQVFIPPTSNIHSYFMKTDLNGNLLWSKTIPNTFLNSIEKTSDGNYLITGTAIDNFGSLDMLLLKVDESGLMLWSNKYGGIDLDFGSQSKVDSNGNIFVIGTFGISNTDDAYLLKLDSSGNLLWSKKYNFSKQIFSAIYLDFFENNDIAVSATYGAWNPLIFRLDYEGNFIWAKEYQGPWVVAENFSVKTTKDGGIIANIEPEGVVSIAIGPQFGLLKTTGDGNVEWFRMYNWDIGVFPNGFVETNDGGYASLGTIEFGGINIVKTDEFGHSACNDTSIQLSTIDTIPTITTGGMQMTGVSDLILSIVQNGSFASYTPRCYDSIYIIQETPAIGYSIPNVFTPNNDGINDNFWVTTNGITELNGAIYNRWGEIITNINGINSSWNGNSKNGTKATDGVYYYIIKLKNIDNKEFIEKGFIQLIR
jgi:gliding motility-associated-like protein